LDHSLGASPVVDTRQRADRAGRTDWKHAARYIAARWLTAVIVDPARIAANTTVEIHCEAPDHELPFADWLNALIFEMAARKMLFGRFAVALHDHALEAKAWGEPLDRRRHQPAVEVKGATSSASRPDWEAPGHCAFRRPKWTPCFAAGRAGRLARATGCPTISNASRSEG
jgi:tRNA nucleotidyltransferase (CCA-adding enzyme)